MKTKLIVFTLLATHSVWSAAFMNLNFESAIEPLIVDPVSHTIPVTQAMPGWHVFVGGTEITTVLYNNRHISLAGVSLYSRGDSPLFAIEGDYFAHLYSGLVSPLPTGASAAVAQTGLIPNDAQSLQLKTGRNGEPFFLSIGGNTLSMTPVFTGLNYVLHAADISVYAGQDLELRISVPYDGIAPNGQAHGIRLDDIQFSTEPVPEPSVIALLAFAAAGLLWHLRRRG